MGTASTAVRGSSVIRRFGRSVDRLVLGAAASVRSFNRAGRCAGRW